MGHAYSRGVHTCTMINTVDSSKSKNQKKIPDLAEQVFDTCGHLKSLRNQNF